MATKKQYFRASLKLQNEAWHSNYNNIGFSFYQCTKSELNSLRLQNCLSLAYTRLWMYIASESFEQGEEFDGLIDNLFPVDVLSMVEDYFDYNKLTTVKPRHKLVVAYEIYVGLFPDTDLAEFIEYSGYRED